MAAADGGGAPASDELVLGALAGGGRIDNSIEFARASGVDHGVLVGVIQSLAVDGFVVTRVAEHISWQLTDEARGFLQDGSPEARVFRAVPADGIPRPDLQAAVGKAVAGIGFAQAMKQKWITLDKAKGLVVRLVADIEDAVAAQLRTVAGDGHVAADTLAALKKRQLLLQIKTKSFGVDKGPQFAPSRVKLVTDVTKEMLDSGSWENAAFKPYNFDALGQLPPGGHLHPLLKVRAQFREIFLEMGFEEMETNRFVESSFWNFDALFQPQAHPARDAHDTFFISDPAAAPRVPGAYLQRVKTTHEEGGYGSLGYRYKWKEEEARKNILRTHTTAVSSRTLHALAQQQPFKPKKYFSIDRVFRNEELDATHLAEFHQIEGIVIDRNMSLGHLIGMLTQFFQKLGITRLRFKPTYNPYTEPSMEVYSWHDGLKKWVELGNSGIFRPEMLRPMGFPPDVGAIAWGLSLERPTMILYEINNIRDLFGHKVDIGMIRRNPICRLVK